MEPDSTPPLERNCEKPANIHEPTKPDPGQVSDNAGIYGVADYGNDEVSFTLNSAESTSANDLITDGEDG